MRPWIKLHTSTLDDTRILRLNERQQLRYYQLYLLAGRLNADGLFIENGSRLDDVDIAIKLRITDAKQFTADLKSLKQAGLIKVNGKGPFVEAFGREQVDWSKKQELERERKARQRDKDGHADVTRDKVVTPAKSRKGHKTVTVVDQNQTKKKIKKEKEIKNQPPPTPSTKRKPQAAPLAGGGDKSSSPSWLDQIAPAGHQTAMLIAPILRSSGLGQAKIVTLLHKVATRIKPPDAIRYTLAALASAYADKDVQKKPIVAAYRIEQDSVPPIFLNSHTWNCLPAEVLAAADVDPQRLPKQSSSASSDVIRKVAQNVATR